MLGRVDEGIALAQETVRLTEATNHRTWEPVTYRVLGDLLVKAHQSGDSKLAEAELAYEKALNISRAKSAKGFELVAATGLAHLWKIQGKTKDAYDLLAPIYDWFTEGFDTKDLKDAKALLQELSA
jgi:predicted ATPase